MITTPLAHGIRVRATILGLFIGVQVLDAAFTYMSVGVLGVAAEQNPLLAWSMAIFGIGATLAAAKTVAVACGIVLLRAGCYGTTLFLTNLNLYVAVVPGAALIG